MGGMPGGDPYGMAGMAGGMPGMVIHMAWLVWLGGMPGGDPISLWVAWPGGMTHSLWVACLVVIPYRYGRHGLVA